MKAWLQSADLSAVDLEPAPDAEGAVRALQGHDWAGEAARRAALERAGAEWCDPGLGLVRADGHLLHICPSGATATVHHRFSERVLGMLWRRTRLVSTPSVAMADLPQLVRAFYAHDDALLAKRLV